MSVVSRALLLAHAAHKGQVDKSGQPYIGHPERVAARLSDPTEQVVGWLHDVVEDTDVDLPQIRMLFGKQVAEAVDAITHRPFERNLDYYARVRANPIALAVKAADIADNADPQRLARLDPASRARLTKKYTTALIALGLV